MILMIVSAILTVRILMEALFVSVDLGLLAMVELLELDVLVSIIIVAIVYTGSMSWEEPLICNLMQEPDPKPHASLIILLCQQK